MKTVFPLENLIRLDRRDDEVPTVDFTEEEGLQMS